MLDATVVGSARFTSVVSAGKVNQCKIRATAITSENQYADRNQNGMSQYLIFVHWWSAH